MGVLSRLPVVKGETDLRYHNLTQIPENTCHDETVLDLSHNKLTILVKHVFILLTNLKTLNLQHNRIGMIEPGAFAGLSTLPIRIIRYADVITFTWTLCWLDSCKAFSRLALQPQYGGFAPKRKQNKAVLRTNFQEVAKPNTNLHWVKQAVDFPRIRKLHRKTHKSRHGPQQVIQHSWLVQI